MLKALVQKQIELYQKNCIGLKTIGVPKKFDHPTGFPSMRDVHRYETHINKAVESVKELQVVLCISRNALFKLYFSSTEKQLPIDLVADIEKEKAIHLEHRRAEWKEELSRLIQLGKELQETDPVNYAMVVIKPIAVKLSSSRLRLIYSISVKNL